MSDSFSITSANPATSVADSGTPTFDSARAMSVSQSGTYVVSGVTHTVTGSGVKIGIISDSFNVDGNLASDQAKGYLPAGSQLTYTDTPTHTGVDEGRAMAELIHQVAPGATIDFHYAGTSSAQVAQAVSALVAQGCNIIVDDVFSSDEPFFQAGGSLYDAINSAVSAGVDYVSAAGNFGQNYWQQAFNAGSFTEAFINPVSKVTAATFANGTDRQAVTLGGNATARLVLQWDQPFKSIGTGSQGSANSLALYLFDQNGFIVASATGNRTGQDPIQALTYTNPTANTETLNLVVVLNAGTAPGLFKYIDFGGNLTPVDLTRTATGDLIGHSMMTNTTVVGAVPYVYGQTPLAEGYSSYGPGETIFSAQGSRLASPAITNEPVVAAPDQSPTSLNPTGFAGTSAAAANAAGLEALVLQANPTLTTSQVTSILKTSAIPEITGNTLQAGAGVIQASGTNGAIAQAYALEQQTACYLAGTKLLTRRGEVAIECLTSDDRVLTRFGAFRPVRWIGHRRIDPARHPTPMAVMPIRIARDALGPGQPHRDVFVSPDHALFLDGVLVPAKCLVNGGSIAPVRLAAIHYVHIELDSHDIVVADGLPAESWLDTGNRSMFENADPARLVYVTPDPGAATIAWTTNACAPLLCEGPYLRAIADRLGPLRAGRNHPISLAPLVSPSARW